MFISVVLPAPFSPSRAWISPGRTSRSIRSLATTPGYRLLIPRISSAGAWTGASETTGWVLVTAVATPSACRTGQAEVLGTGYRTAGRPSRSDGPRIRREGRPSADRSALLRAGLEAAGLHRCEGGVEL